MTARLAMLMALAATLDTQPTPSGSYYGTRGKVGTSAKVKARRKRERQNRKRGRA
jgi:hypothetical protein